MGGFEGGDEAGFWEVTTPPNFINKQNQKNKEKTHILRNNSGFSIKVYNQDDTFNDTLRIEPSEFNTFTILGCENIPLESNIIYKAYQTLIEFTDDTDIVEFFSQYKVVLISKNSHKCVASHAAAFLYLAKELCNLVLLPDELEEIANITGDDVAIYLRKYI